MSTPGDVLRSIGDTVSGSEKRRRRLNRPHCCTPSNSNSKTRFTKETTMNTCTRFVSATILLIVSTAGAGCHNFTQSMAEAKKESRARYLSHRSALKLTIAQQDFEAGDLDKAEKTLVEAMGKDDSNPLLFVLAGRIALERGQLERSLDRFEKAIELDDTIPDGFYFKGIVHQRWKQYDKAHDSYNKAYELQQDNVAFLLAVSDMLVAMEKRDEAVDLLESKTTYFENNAGLRIALADLYMLRQDHAKAVEYYRQASLLRPDDMRVKENLALARIAAGRFDEAIEDYQDLLRKSEKAEARTGYRKALAGAYLGARRWKEAREAYVELTRLDRADIESWVKLGEISLATQDYPAALSAANRVITLGRTRPEGYLMAGMVWQQRADWPKALANFDRAVQVAPDNVDAMILRGITLEQAGRPAAAAQAYREAQRRAPQDRRIPQLLAGVEQ